MLIDFLGDSITEGVGASSYEKCFVSRVSQLLKCEVINHGIGGTRFAHQSKPSDEPRWDLDFCSRLKELNPNADLVFVFGGTNDFGHGDAPIGNIDDDTPNTFCGACNYIINYLLKLYKIEQISFILPLHRVGEDNPRGDGYKEPPSLVLEGYRNVIKEVLDKRKIPYVDFRDNFGKAENNPLFMDGLHPSDEGHNLLAELIVKYIKEKFNV